MNKLFYILLLLFAFQYNGDCQSSYSNLDSLRFNLNYQSPNDSLYIENCFAIARYYDDKNQFDSMQYYLNKGFPKLSIKEVTILHYNFSAFQAIAHYYNGLLKMDLFESKKVLQFALTLKDSVLITTGYNFMGLGYSNLKEYRKGIPYLLEGIKFAKLPPYQKKYLVYSKPHQLHGNLAEAYYKLGVYDSAIVSAKKSLELAYLIESKRGVAVAQNYLGLIYEKKSRYDSANYFQNLALQNSLKANELDIALIANGGLASIANNMHQQKIVKQFITNGMNLLQNENHINYYFTKQFLLQAKDLSNEMKDIVLSNNILNRLIENNARINSINDNQVAIIIQNNIEREKKANQQLLKEANQKNRFIQISLILTIIAFLSILTAFFFYLRNEKRKSKEVAIRNELSRDLHDDIGSTLSSIKLYSEMASKSQFTYPSKSNTLIQKVTDQSEELISRLSDVIYILKRDENNQSISDRIKRIGQDLLMPANIQLKYNAEPRSVDTIENPFVIKNIFLIVKEILNNTAKYSQADRCEISISKVGNNIEIIINDNGVGFDLSINRIGNGLQNIQDRIKSIKGLAEIESSIRSGTSIKLKIPISTNRYILNDQQF